MQRIDKATVSAWKWAKYARRRTTPGTSPGLLTADPQAPKPVIGLLGFGPEGHEERQGIVDPGEVKDFLGRHPVTWVNVEGLGDEAVLERLGKLFSLHGLALEDVINVHQRPKVEVFGEHLFVVLRAAHGGPSLEGEQISLFLGTDYVISFQERAGELLEPVRRRIREGRPRFRAGRADYLAYAILDAVLDAYFPVLEAHGENLEALEEEILRNPNQDVVPRIHQLKRDLMHLRRDGWPMREFLSVLYRDEHPLISAQTRIYLRDCYDHAVQLLDLIESYRDFNSDLMDLYLSSLNNRMNEVMKLLTIISTIFMPLSFVAGVYGMNFSTAASPWNMPELGWRFGYFFSLAIMALVSGVMLFYFRHKGWLGRGGDRGGSR